MLHKSYWWTSCYGIDIHYIVALENMKISLQSTCHFLIGWLPYKCNKKSIFRFNVNSISWTSTRRTSIVWSNQINWRLQSPPSSSPSMKFNYHFNWPFNWIEFQCQQRYRAISEQFHSHLNARSQHQVLHLICVSSAFNVFCIRE